MKLIDKSLPLSTHLDFLKNNFGIPPNQNIKLVNIKYDAESDHVNLLNDEETIEIMTIDNLLPPLV